MCTKGFGDLKDVSTSLSRQRLPLRLRLQQPVRIVIVIAMAMAMANCSDDTVVAITNGKIEEGEERKGEEEEDDAKGRSSTSHILFCPSIHQYVTVNVRYQTYVSATTRTRHRDRYRGTGMGI